MFFLFEVNGSGEFLRWGGHNRAGAYKYNLSKTSIMRMHGFSKEPTLGLLK